MLHELEHGFGEDAKRLYLIPQQATGLIPPSAHGADGPYPELAGETHLTLGFSERRLELPLALTVGLIELVVACFATQKLMLVVHWHHGLVFLVIPVFLLNIEPLHLASQ